jgi:hypothetical protein
LRVARPKPVRHFVEAAILAIKVAEQVRRQERVVDGGVEDGALIGRAALHRYAAQRFAPDGFRVGVDGIEVPAGNLRVQVHFRVGDTDERESHLRQERAGAGLKRNRTSDGVTGPTAVGMYGLVEADHEIQGVFVFHPAKAAAAHDARHGVLGPDLHRCGVLLSLRRAASGVQVERGGGACRKREPPHAGASGGGEFHAHTVSEGERIVTRMRLFAGVIER